MAAGINQTTFQVDSAISTPLRNAVLAPISIGIGAATVADLRGTVVPIAQIKRLTGRAD